VLKERLMSRSIPDVRGAALVVALLAGCAAGGRPAECPGEHRVSSPDGTIAVVVADQGGLRYRLDVDSRAVIAPSRLGLEFEGGLAIGPAAAIIKSETSERRGSWENPFGKRRVVPDRWNELRLTLREADPSGRDFGLIVRVFDDGAAFRYDLPGPGEFVLARERTEFAFAGDWRSWLGEPSACAESRYLEAPISRIPAAFKDKDAPEGPYLGVLPLLVETPAALVAVAEADLLDWAGMFLSGTGTPAVAVTLAPRADRRGCVISRTPRMSPWRVLMVGRKARDLVASDLVATLSSPSRITDVSWIRPGACAWDAWWTGVNPHLPQYREVWSRGDTKSHMEYIDFAAEIGWPYQLVDWFWYRNMSSYEVILNHGAPDPNKPPVDFAKSEPHIDMPTLLDHARRRGVRLLIWLHSDDLNRYGIDKAFALLSGWGAAGVKIDFMNSDGQETVAWYARVLEIAARHKLMVDFHGAYKATGLTRTWPNLVTQEGVLGNEYNKLDTRCTPLHTVTLPFTRGLLGPMDFTPGGFLNRPVKAWRKTAPAEVMGTRARQLAMPVIYESPLTVFCDSPSHYRGQPGIEFYRGLPTVWEETAVPSAEVACHIVVARRSGGRWWLAAMNGEEALAVRVPLSFLGPGRWTLRGFSDGSESAERAETVVESLRTVGAGEDLELRLAPAGGFAGVLSPTSP
jgi:alpha-glucosidase